MKINKKMTVGVLVLIILVLGSLYYWKTNEHPTGGNLSEITDHINIEVNTNNEKGYTLEIFNNNESDLTSCDIEIYDQNRMDKGSKEIFTYTNFKLKQKSSIDIDTELAFDDNQYIRLTGYRGSNSKDNKITIEGKLSAIIAQKSKQ